MRTFFRRCSTVRDYRRKSFSVRRRKTNFLFKPWVRKHRYVASSFVEEQEPWFFATRPISKEFSVDDARRHFKRKVRRWQVLAMGSSDQTCRATRDRVERLDCKGKPWREERQRFLGVWIFYQLSSRIEHSSRRLALIRLIINYQARDNLSIESKSFACFYSSAKSIYDRTTRS